MKKNIMKTVIAGIAVCGTIAFGNPNTTYAEEATVQQRINVPQRLMNLYDNPNYVLIYENMGIGYYLDINSIVIKKNDEHMRFWAQNIIPINMKTGEYGNPSTIFYAFDRDKEYTERYNSDTQNWEVFQPFDCRKENQVEARAYSIGYIFAFQGGNPAK